MNNSTTDAGLIEVLLERLEKQRLPGLLALKWKQSLIKCKHRKVKSKA